MKRIKVNTSTPTEIIIGNNINIKEEIDESRKALLLIDSNVFNTYGKAVMNNLNACIYLINPKESSKSMSSVINILNFMAFNGLTRKDIVITMGGGITTDLGGFVSSIYNRGMRVYHIPTTLLADVDAAIGGKTGVNTGYGKNIVGTFHHPTKVLIDVKYLQTLNEKQIRCGKAEILKYAFIDNLKLLNLINSDNWEEIITQSIMTKIKFIESDEYDNGKRMILNFGHTIGHAIEKQSNYKINHGEAVAIGMATMGRYFGINEIEHEIKKTGLKVTYNGEPKKLMNYILNDKKREDNFYNIIVPESFGKCRIYKTNEKEIFEIIKRVKK